MDYRILLLIAAIIIIALYFLYKEIGNIGLINNNIALSIFLLYLACLSTFNCF